MSQEERADLSPAQFPYMIILYDYIEFPYMIVSHDYIEFPYVIILYDYRVALMPVENPGQRCE